MAMACMALHAVRADEFIGYSFYASESLSVVLAKAALDTAWPTTTDITRLP